MGRACSTHGAKRNVGKPEGKRPLGRTRRRLEYNIKIDPGEIGSGGMDLIDLAQCRALVNTIMDLRVSQNSGSLFVKNSASWSELFCK
jgi:hypothetical protein